MGLLDAILGGVMRGQAGAPTGMSGLVRKARARCCRSRCSCLQQHGGLQGVLGKFQQAGYGEQAQSWIGTGPNMPIDAGALSQIFGPGYSSRRSRSSSGSRTTRRPASSRRSCRTSSTG